MKRDLLSTVTKYTKMQRPERHSKTMCLTITRLFNLAAVLGLGVLTATAATFTVTTTNDSGGGSLRQAHPASERTRGPDTIAVNTPGGGVQAASWRIV